MTVIVFLVIISMYSIVIVLSAIMVVGYVAQWSTLFQMQFFFWDYAIIWELFAIFLLSICINMYNLATYNFFLNIHCSLLTLSYFILSVSMR